MLIIRLQRIGRKNQPYFRVVLIEHSRKVAGKFNELLGSYDPRSKNAVIKKERVLYWISKGVQVSPTAHNLFVGKGVIEGKKVQAWKPKKKAAGKEAPAAAAPKEAPAEARPAEPAS